MISRPDVKVDVPSIKEQQEAQKEKWKQERIENEKREKVRVASEAQVGYIKAIAKYLKVDDPTDGMLFIEAKDWLNNVFSENPKLESDMKRAKLEEKKSRPNNEMPKFIKKLNRVKKRLKTWQKNTT